LPQCESDERRALAFTASGQFEECSNCRSIRAGEICSHEAQQAAAKPAGTANEVPDAYNLDGIVKASGRPVPQAGRFFVKQKDFMMSVAKNVWLRP
jgi:hypothetical protein